jgi:tetratricopeptide (TPR) repeat protein
MTTADHFSPPLRKAFRLLETGRDLEADDLLVEQKERALDRYGSNSLEYAQAVFDHGYLCLSAGNMFEGIEFLAEALKSVPREKNSWRLVGSIAYQLGSALNSEKRYAESEYVLRESMSARERAFGRSHLEWYAGALELSESLLGIGRLSEAQALLQDAVAAFARAEDILTFEAMALKCIVDQQLQLPTAELKLISQWEDGDLQLLMDRFKHRLRPYPVETQLNALERLCEAAMVNLPDMKLLFKLEALRETSWKSKECGQYARAEAYLNKSIGLASHFDDTHEVVWSLLMLGTTLQEAGDIPRAEQTILTALSEAQQEESDQLAADGMRSYAKLLSATGRAAHAEAYFAQAVELARKSNHFRALTLAETDLAMFVQHRGRYEEAHQMFHDILDRVDDDYFDLKTIRDHLDARNAEYSCGCYKDTDSDAILEAVTQQIDPDGKLCDVVAALDIGRSYNVQVQLKRPATPEEQELLNVFCEAAISELRRLRKEANTARMRNGVA